MLCGASGLLLLKEASLLQFHMQVSYFGKNENKKKKIRANIRVHLFITLCVVGPTAGNVISFPLSALLCVYGFDGGWPSVFYIFGSTIIIMTNATLTFCDIRYFRHCMVCILVATCF